MLVLNLGTMDPKENLVTSLQPMELVAVVEVVDLLELVMEQKCVMLELLF